MSGDWWRRGLPWHGQAAAVRGVWRRRFWRRAWVPTPLTVLAALVAGLGAFGFSGVTQPDGRTLDALQVGYRTVRLFTLNLDLPDGARVPTTLWFAAWLAPLTTITLIARLARERMRAFVMRRLLRGHVVVCGVGVRGAEIVRQRMDAGRLVVAIDIDERALGRWTSRTWTVLGDATAAETLHAAGVSRAAEVVVITADDYGNAAVASSICALEARSAPDVVYVHFDDPSMARVLPPRMNAGGCDTPSTAPAGPLERADAIPGQLVPFSTASRAASRALDRAAAHDWAASSDDRPAVAIFGDDALIDAMLLELHRRWEASRAVRQLAANPPTVLLFAPHARRRIDALAARHGTSWTSLKLVAHDVEVDVTAPLSDEIMRLLRGSPPVEEAWVIDRTQLAGVQLAHRLARALGDGGAVRLLSEAPTDEFVRALAKRTATDPSMARIDPMSLVEVALGDGDLEDSGPTSRLARAIRDAERPADAPPTHTEPTAAELGSAAAVLRCGITIVDDPAPVAMRWEQPILEALDLPSSSVFLRAGLRIDALSRETALRAGPRLVEVAEALESAGAHSPAARGAYDRARERAFVYYARVAGALEADGLQTLRDLHSAAVSGNSDTANDIAALLTLRILSLEAATPEALTPDGSEPDAVRPADGDACSSERPAFAFVAGGAASWDSPTGREFRAAAEEHLRVAVSQPVWHGTLISGGTDSGVSGVVGALAGVRKIGYLPATENGQPVAEHDGYDERFPGDRDGFSIADPLRAWARLIEDKIDPADVPVLVYPGGSITRQEVALARALGADVGVVQFPGVTGTSALAEAYEAWDRVTPLSSDPMVVRAFLRSPSSDQVFERQCWTLAEAIHETYRAEQLATGVDPSDPSCTPWARLSDPLRHSNWAQAVHIPAKLEALGLRIARPDEHGGPLDLGLPATVDTAQPFSDPELERLAEMEHGRWVVERVRRGWREGTRKPLQLLTDSLVPWAALDAVRRAKDRDVIARLPALLAQAGLTVTSLDGDTE